MANGPGLSGGVSGERTSFTIEARDRFDNRIRVGGDSFRVRASGNGAARFAAGALARCREHSSLQVRVRP